MSKFDVFVDELERVIRQKSANRKPTKDRNAPKAEKGDMRKSIIELERLGALYTKELQSLEAEMRQQRQAAIVQKLASIRDQVFQAVMDGLLTADEAASLETLLNNHSAQQHDRLMRLSKEMTGRKIEALSTGGGV